jgi:hypothetical protein
MVNTRLVYFIAALALFAPVSVHAQPAPRLLHVAASSKARRELLLTPVKRKPVMTRITATAIIEPDANAVAQVTSQIPARVVKLLAQLGEQVEAGQALAIMSSVELGQAKTERSTGGRLADRSRSGTVSANTKSGEWKSADSLVCVASALRRRRHSPHHLAEHRACHYLQTAAVSSSGQESVCRRGRSSVDRSYSERSDLSHGVEERSE